MSMLLKSSNALPQAGWERLPASRPLIQTVRHCANSVVSLRPNGGGLLCSNLSFYWRTWGQKILGGVVPFELQVHCRPTFKRFVSKSPCSSETTCFRVSLEESSYCMLIGAWRVLTRMCWERRWGRQCESVCPSFQCFLGTVVLLDSSHTAAK